MTEEQLDAEIRAAFEALEPPADLVERLDDRPRKRPLWRSEAIFVGVAAVAALALFIPYVLVQERTPEEPTVAPAFQQPSGSRVIQLDVAGVLEGWPEPGAKVDVLATRSEGGAVSVDAVLTEVVVAEAAREGKISVAVDPSLAVRAVHASQTAALTLAVVLPDGRRVVELRDDTPLRVGDRVDVLVTAEREGELETWTALRGAEVLYLGPEGPLVAVGADQAAEAVSIQHSGRIWLSRYHED